MICFFFFIFMQGDRCFNILYEVLDPDKSHNWHMLLFLGCFQKMHAGVGLSWEETEEHAFIWTFLWNLGECNTFNRTLFPLSLKIVYIREYKILGKGEKEKKKLAYFLLWPGQSYNLLVSLMEHMRGGKKQDLMT